VKELDEKNLVDFVRIQARTAGNYMVTIPADIIVLLKPKAGERIKVYFDKETKRVIYQF
jgi:hypothetical protein